MRILVSDVRQTRAGLVITFAEPFSLLDTPAGTRAMRILRMFVGPTGHKLETRSITLGGGRHSDINTKAALQRVFDQFADVQVHLTFVPVEVRASNWPYTLHDPRKVQQHQDQGRDIWVRLHVISNLPILGQDLTRLGAQIPHSVLSRQPDSAYGLIIDIRLSGKQNPWSVAEGLKPLIRRIIV